MWLAAGLALAYFMIAQYDADFYARYVPKFISGFVVTVQIVALSVVIGALISLPIAAGRMSKKLIASMPSYAFVYFFRGTPLIAQTFLVYYGAGQFRAGLRDALVARADIVWEITDAAGEVILTSV